MVMLIPLDRLPAWIVMLIIAREIAVTGLRSIAVNRGVVIQASALGKYKTALQVTATIGLCLHYEYFKIASFTVDPDYDTVAPGVSCTGTTTRPVSS